MMGAHDAFLRWCYRDGRPNRLAAALNRVSAVLSSAGLWPSRMATLEVRGRRSGRPVSFPMVLAELHGDRYLVAMLGEGTNWVANVRADGGRAVLGHGRREAVRLEEVPADRGPVSGVPRSRRRRGRAPRAVGADRPWVDRAGPAIVTVEARTC